MRRKLTRILLAALLIGLVSLLSACGKQEAPQQAAEEVQEEPAAAAAETHELAGEYMIDITNLGMALQFYLRIDEDNSFMLSPNRQFSDSRGDGTIGELEGTYLMIYSDSTQENPKTATFERVGPNLIFRSTLPYGSAKIHFEVEDDENPEIIHRLIANKYIYEEYYGTYFGFQTAGDVEYQYVLELGPGGRYKLGSQLASGDGQPVYEEQGSYRVKDGSIWITPQDGEELAGSVSEEGALELEVRPNEEADRSKVLFRVATTAAHAGTWYAQNEEGALALLSMDFFGGYNLTVTAEGESTVEEGGFEAAQNTITFTKAGEDGSVTATKTGYILEAPFNGADWLFYEESVQGSFTGGTMVNEAYKAALELNPDGSYSLVIVDEESDLELVNELGEFTITAGPMSYMITLNSDAGTARVGAIWPTGLNMTFDIAGTDYSFLLTK
jgi:hypothetical protein